MNIQTKAWEFVRQNKKIKKDDIKKTIEALYDSVDDQTSKDCLSLLYTAMIPKINPKKNDLAWVGLAQSRDKHEYREEYKNIAVLNGYAMSTDGFRIHAIKLPKNKAVSLSGKFIDEHYNIIDTNSFNDGFWGRSLDLIKQKKTNECVFKLDDFLVTVVDNNEIYEILIQDERCFFNKKYVDQILNGADSFIGLFDNYQIKNSCLSIKIDDKKCCVIMPIKV